MPRNGARITTTRGADPSRSMWRSTRPGEGIEPMKETALLLLTPSTRLSANNREQVGTAEPRAVLTQMQKRGGETRVGLAARAAAGGWRRGDEGHDCLS